MDEVSHKISAYSKENKPHPFERKIKLQIKHYSMSVIKVITSRWMFNYN